MHANDFSFFEEIDELVQEEPAESLDPERAGQTRGRRHPPRKSFDRTNACAASSTPPRGPPPGSAGELVYFRVTRAATCTPARRGSRRSSAAATSSCNDHARLLDARTLFHYFATVITPAMAHAQVGAAPRTPTRPRTRKGRSSTAARPTGTLPPNPPAKNSGRSTSTTTQTRSLLQTDNPYPSLMSLSGTVEPEDDGRSCCGSGRRRRRVGNRTGFAPSRTRVGSRCPAVRTARALVRRDVVTERTRGGRSGAQLTSTGHAFPPPARSAGCENRCPEVTMVSSAKPPAYTMRQLFVFVAVAETGTIRAAADPCTSRSPRSRSRSPNSSADSSHSCACAGGRTASNSPRRAKGC